MSEVSDDPKGTVGAKIDVKIGDSLVIDGAVRNEYCLYADGDIRKSRQQRRF